MKYFIILLLLGCVDQESEKSFLPEYPKLTGVKNCRDVEWNQITASTYYVKGSLCYVKIDKINKCYLRTCDNRSATSVDLTWETCLEYFPELTK